MSEPKDPSSSARLLGLGFELVASVAGFTLVGYWVDRHFATSPWGVLSGLALGLVGGMYNMIRQSLAVSKAAGSGTKPTRGDREL